MRLYTVHELEAQLKAKGCLKTEEKSATATFWYTKNKVLFSVPAPDEHSGKYSDFVFYELRAFVEDN